MSVTKKQLCELADKLVFHEVFQALDKITHEHTSVYTGLKFRYIANEKTFEFASQVKAYISLLDIPEKETPIEQQPLAEGLGLFLQMAKMAEEKGISPLSIMAEFEGVILNYAKRYDDPEDAKDLFRQILTLKGTENLTFDHKLEKVIQTVLQDNEVRAEHKCVFVSALTVNLLKQFDEKIFNLLLIAMFEADEMVWQRAFLGLILGTQRWHKTLNQPEHTKIRTKIANLSTEERVYKALPQVNAEFEFFAMIYDSSDDFETNIGEVALAYYQGYISFQQIMAMFEDFMERNQQGAFAMITTLFSKLGEMRATNEMGFQDAFHWFLPLYDQPQFRQKLIASGKDVDYQILFEGFKELNKIMPASFSYQLLQISLEMPEWIIEKQTQTLKDFNIRFTADINSGGAAYFGMLMDLWAFKKHFPDEKLKEMIQFDDALRKNDWLKLIAEKKYYHQYMILRNHAQENVEGVIENAVQYLALNPHNADLWEGLADIYYEQDQTTLALEAYQKSVEVDNQRDEAWNSLGIIYNNELQDYEKAIECYEKATQINPNNHLFWDNKGDAYINLGKYDLAIVCYEEVTRLEPKHETAWISLGRVNCVLQNYEKGLECFEKAIQIDPNAHWAWDNKAHVYSDLGKYDLAVECYEEAIRIKPDFGSAWGSLGWLHFTQANFVDAERCFLQGIGLGCKTNDKMNLGHIRLTQNNIQEAVRLYQECLVAYDSAEDFFNGMLDDFQYLEPQGITKEFYESILAQLVEWYNERS